MARPLGATRRCSRCKQTFPLIEFPSQGKKADGSVRRHYYCVLCKRESDAETRQRIRDSKTRSARAKQRYRQRYRAQRNTPEYQEYMRAYRANPEVKRLARERERERRQSSQFLAHQREMYRARMARLSLEQREKVREGWRLRQWEERRRKGARETPRDNKPDPTHPRLPIGPFQWWLRQMHDTYGDYGFLGDLLGVHPDLVRRYATGYQRSVSLAVVDRALSLEGGTFLAELYPELYPDATPGVLYMLRIAAQAEAHQEAA